MIGLALRHELQATRRSVSRLVVLGAFVVAGIYAITAGQQFRQQWVDALSAAEAEQADRQTSAREWLAEGVSGPDSSPWVDITAPLWQDWYAGTRLQRVPASLAGIAAGAVDASPVAIPVNRLADPFGVAGLRLENPENDSTQVIDLVFVFVLLIPIVLSVMGMGIGGYEREMGMEPWVAVQAGSASSWYLARVVAVTWIVLAVVWLLCLAVVGVSGAGAVEALQLVGLAGLFTLLWGGVLAAVGATARSVQEGAFAYGLVWALTSVLLPSVLAEQALSRSASAYDLETTLEARSEQYESYDRDIDKVLPELYEAFPDLTALPAAKLEALPPTVRRHAYDGVLVLALERRHQERRERELKADRAMRRSVWLSPAVALSHGFEGLAGRGTRSASDFRDRVVGAVRARVEWLLQAAWRQEPLAAADFERLVASAEVKVPPGAGAVGLPMVALAVWAGLAWGLGVVRLRRLDRLG